VSAASCPEVLSPEQSCPGVELHVDEHLEQRLLLLRGVTKAHAATLRRRWKQQWIITILQKQQRIAAGEVLQRLRASAAPALDTSKFSALDFQSPQFRQAHQSTCSTPDTFNDRGRRKLFE
jgi:hypothetical protein